MLLGGCERAGVMRRLLLIVADFDLDHGKSSTGILGEPGSGV